jgi:hypothetical protein
MAAHQSRNIAERNFALPQFEKTTAYRQSDL